MAALDTKQSDHLFENVRFRSDESSQSRIRTSSSPFYGLEANHTKHSARQEYPKNGGLNKKPSILEEVIDWLKKMLDYCLCCLSCGCYRPPGADLGVEATDSELMYGERDAVHMLLAYLDSDEAKFPTINDARLRALSVLTFSDNTDLQRSAALCFAEISERMQSPVTTQILEPLVVLLRSREPRTQQAASLAISNFAIYGPESNKGSLARSGAVVPMVHLLSSRNVEVQCNTCAFVTTLASCEKHQSSILRTNAIPQLLKLTQSKDMRVQRNSTGAILNLTHTQTNRDSLVNAGALPVLVEVLKCPDSDTKYYCTAALSNLAIYPLHRTMMSAIGYNDVIVQLIRLLSIPQQRVACQACLALRNLASDVDNQVLIVRLAGLKPLHTLIQNGSGETLVAALACLRNLSMHLGNEAVIIRETFVTSLATILNSQTSHMLPAEAKTHAAGILRNLAAGNHVHVLQQRGCVEVLLDLCLDPTVPVPVLTEITAAIAVLSDYDDIKDSLLTSHSGALLSRLAHVAATTDNDTLCYNCAGTVAQLVPCELTPALLASCVPSILRYLEKVMNAHRQSSFLHLALWTIVQLLRYPLFSNAFHESTLPSIVASLVDNCADSNDSELTELLDSITEKISSTPTHSDGTSTHSDGTPTHSD